MDVLMEFMYRLISEQITQAIVILLVSLGAARLIDKLLTKFLYRLARRTKTELDDLVIEELHKPVTRSTILLGLSITISVLQLSKPIELLGFRLLLTVAGIVWMVAAMRLSSRMFIWMSRHRTRFQAIQPASLPLFSIGSRVLLVVGAIYTGMLCWQIDLAGWLASVGVVGIAVGFAARDTLANLFAGVSILADAPYQVGDYIVLTGESKRGKVTQIGLRSTRILTRDDIEIVIPNSTIANSTVVNESGGPTIRQRIRLRVGLAYGSSVEQVRETLLASAQNESIICDNPAPRVRFREFADSGLIFDLLCWIEEAELRGRAIDALHTRVYTDLKKAGIEIPFPQRDIHLKSGTLSSNR